MIGDVIVVVSIGSLPHCAAITGMIARVNIQDGCIMAVVAATLTQKTVVGHGVYLAWL